tara:strand:+ start:985 stop:2130 length:1146 start_codon:yes stop_codon:yes gene_type:complete
MLLIGWEMLGKKSAPEIESRVTYDADAPARNCVVMFPTNGVGFGHFTRTLALAKRMKKLDPELEIIFFTTMPTLHLLKEHGISAHYISGPKYFKDMESSEWNALLEDELSLCIDTHRPKCFIFDGAFPYRGMLRAIHSRDDIDKLWMRRGTFRKGSSIPVDSIDFFDAIIHPEDSVKRSTDLLEHSLEVISCPPILVLDEEEKLSRELARRRLGIPMKCTAVYVQLGAGEINDIDSEIRLTISALTENNGVHIILGESLIGDRLEINLNNVHIIRDYPNAMYFNGFDATVQAGGYNSFHETRQSSLPALFYPNMNTGMDDQEARCNIAVEEGWGIVVVERNDNSIRNGVSKLLEKTREHNDEFEPSGAWVLAEKILARIDK